MKENSTGQQKHKCSLWLDTQWTKFSSIFCLLQALLLQDQNPRAFDTQGSVAWAAQAGPPPWRDCPLPRKMGMLGWKIPLIWVLLRINSMIHLKAGKHVYTVGHDVFWHSWRTQSLRPRRHHGGCTGQLELTGQQPLLKPTASSSNSGTMGAKRAEQDVVTR